jgi:phosphocarrier protein HPr
MPKYEREGQKLPDHRHRLHGGRHRSVAIAEALARYVSVRIGRADRVFIATCRGRRVRAHRHANVGASRPPIADERASRARAQRRASRRSRRRPLRGEASRLPHAGRRPDERSQGRFKIVNQLGLHARAATKLVQLASKYPCDVEITRDDQSANGKSVMGVLLLCGSMGTVVEVRAGERAEECVKAIGQLIATGSESPDERSPLPPPPPAGRSPAQRFERAARRRPEGHRGQPRRGRWPRAGRRRHASGVHAPGTCRARSSVEIERLANGRGRREASHARGERARLPDGPLETNGILDAT